MWSKRFVEPPKAAWTTIALRIAASVRISPRVRPLRGQGNECSGGSAGHVAPDRLARGGQGSVRERDPQGLGDDLRGGRGAQELAAAAGAGTGPATELGCLGQGELAVGVACADRLDLSGVFTVAGRQSHAAGNQHAGELFRPRQGHHHGGEPLVAGCDPQHALAARERADQAPEDDGCIVAIRQAVHHPGRPLGPAVAGVGNHPGKRYHVEAPQFLGGLLDENPDLPVARMIAQRDRLAVGPPQTSLGAENQVWVASNLGGRPSHPGVLGQPEQVAGRPIPEHLVGQRQRAGRPLGRRSHLVNGWVGGIEDRTQVPAGRRRDIRHGWSCSR